MPWSHIVCHYFSPSSIQVWSKGKGPKSIKINDNLKMLSAGHGQEWCRLTKMDWHERLTRLYQEQNWLRLRIDEFCSPIFVLLVFYIVQSYQQNLRILSLTSVFAEWVWELTKKDMSQQLMIYLAIKINKYI